MIVSLAGIDILFAVHVVSFRVGEQLKRTADHVQAEHGVEVGVVAALGLKRDFEIDKACHICDESGKFGLRDLFEHVFQELDDREEVHIAFKHVGVAVRVFEKRRAHVVEKRSDLDVAFEHELKLSVDVTAVVRDGLNDEKLILRESRDELLKDCAKVDVVVFARLEGRCDVDGFAYGETINVVEVGVFCKVFAAKDVGARVGECDVEMLDLQGERQRHVVLRAVAHIGQVGSRALFVLVKDVARFHLEEFCAEHFGAVALAVVKHFSHHKSAAFACNSISDVEFVRRNVFARSDRAEVLLVVRLHEVARLRGSGEIDCHSLALFSEDVVLLTAVCDVFDCNLFFVTVACRGDRRKRVETLAHKSQGRAKRKVDRIRCVKVYLEIASDFFIEQIFELESQQIFGDVFKDGSEQDVAKSKRELIFVDEQRKRKVFVGEIDFAGSGAVFCHKRFVG